MKNAQSVIFNSRLNSVVLDNVKINALDKKYYITLLFKEFEKLIEKDGDSKILQIKKCIKLVQNSINNYGSYELSKNDEYLENRNQYDEILNQIIAESRVAGCKTIKECLEIICAHRNYFFKDKKYSLYKTNYSNSAWKLKALINEKYIYTNSKNAKDENNDDTPKSKNSFEIKAQQQVVNTLLNSFTGRGIEKILLSDTLTSDQLNKIYCKSNLDKAFETFPRETLICFDTNFDKISYEGKYQVYIKLKRLDNISDYEANILKKIFMDFFYFNIVIINDSENKKLDISVRNIKNLLIDYEILDEKFKKDQISLYVFSNLLEGLINKFIANREYQILTNKKIFDYLDSYLEKNYEEKHKLLFYIVSSDNKKSADILTTRKIDCHIVRISKIRRMLVEIFNMLSYMDDLGYIASIKKELEQNGSKDE